MAFLRSGRSIYQRLKNVENDRLKLEWTAKRFLSKSNYIIHTDAIKNYVLSEAEHIKQLPEGSDTK